jgi:putative endonuclease
LNKTTIFFKKFNPFRFLFIVVAGLRNWQFLKNQTTPFSNKNKVKPSQRKSNLDDLKKYGINAKMSKGYLYILECANGAYYTGSTKYLGLRLQQHQNGEGANFTKKHLPVRLVYYEEFQRIDEAFYREKQIQGWSRKKKEALMSGFVNKLHELAECKNETHFRNVVSTSLNKPLDSGSAVPFDSPAPFDSAPFGSDSTAPFDSAQGAVELGGSLSGAETTTPTD